MFHRQSIWPAVEHPIEYVIIKFFFFVYCLITRAYGCAKSCYLCLGGGGGGGDWAPCDHPALLHSGWIWFCLEEVVALGQSHHVFCGDYPFIQFIQD